MAEENRKNTDNLEVREISTPMDDASFDELWGDYVNPDTEPLFTDELGLFSEDPVTPKKEKKEKKKSVTNNRERSFREPDYQDEERRALERMEAERRRQEEERILAEQARLREELANSNGDDFYQTVDPNGPSYFDYYQYNNVEPLSIHTQVGENSQERLIESSYIEPGSIFGDAHVATESSMFREIPDTQEAAGSPPDTYVAVPDYYDLSGPAPNGSVIGTLINGNEEYCSHRKYREQSYTAPAKEPEHVTDPVYESYKKEEGIAIGPAVQELFEESFRQVREPEARPEPNKPQGQRIQETVHVPNRTENGQADPLHLAQSEFRKTTGEKLSSEKTGTQDNANVPENEIPQDTETKNYGSYHNDGTVKDYSRIPFTQNKGYRRVTGAMERAGGAVFGFGERLIGQVADAQTPAEMQQAKTMARNYMAFMAGIGQASSVRNIGVSDMMIGKAANVIAGEAKKGLPIGINDNFTFKDARALKGVPSVLSRKQLEAATSIARTRGFLKSADAKNPNLFSAKEKKLLADGTKFRDLINPKLSASMIQKSLRTSSDPTVRSLSTASLKDLKKALRNKTLSPEVKDSVRMLYKSKVKMFGKKPAAGSRGKMVLVSGMGGMRLVSGTMRSLLSSDDNMAFAFRLKDNTVKVIRGANKTRKAIEKATRLTLLKQKIRKRAGTFARRKSKQAAKAMARGMTVLGHAGAKASRKVFLDPGKKLAKKAAIKYRTKVSVKVRSKITKAAKKTAGAARKTAKVTKKVGKVAGKAGKFTAKGVGKVAGTPFKFAGGIFRFFNAAKRWIMIVLAGLIFNFLLIAILSISFLNVAGHTTQRVYSTIALEADDVKAAADWVAEKKQGQTDTALSQAKNGPNNGGGYPVTCGRKVYTYGHPANSDGKHDEKASDGINTVYVGKDGKTELYGSVNSANTKDILVAAAVVMGNKIPYYAADEDANYDVAWYAYKKVLTPMFNTMCPTPSLEVRTRPDTGSAVYFCSYGCEQGHYYTNNAKSYKNGWDGPDDITGGGGTVYGKIKPYNAEGDVLSGGTSRYAKYSCNTEEGRKLIDELNTYAGKGAEWNVEGKIPEKKENTKGCKQRPKVVSVGMLLTYDDGLRAYKTADVKDKKGKVVTEGIWQDVTEGGSLYVSVGETYRLEDGTTKKINSESDAVSAKEWYCPGDHRNTVSKQQTFNYCCGHVDCNIIIPIWKLDDVEEANYCPSTPDLMKYVGEFLGAGGWHNQDARDVAWNMMNVDWKKTYGFNVPGGTPTALSRYSLISSGQHTMIRFFRDKDNDFTDEQIAAILACIEDDVKDLSGEKLNKKLEEIWKKMNRLTRSTLNSTTYRMIKAAKTTNQAVKIWSVYYLGYKTPEEDRKLQKKTERANKFVIYVAFNATGNTIVDAALPIADDDTHGYRNVAGLNLMNPDVDCGTFVSFSLQHAGIAPDGWIQEPNLSSDGGAMPTALAALGFDVMKYSGEGNLMEGDILISDGHTEIYIGDGQLVGAHQDYGSPTPGDQSGQEVSINGFYENGWVYVCRIGIADASSGKKKK